MRLEEKIALVTGGGRGIGRAIAVAFAAEGAKVAIMARTSREVEETAELIRQAGGTAIPYTGDVTVFQEVDQMVGDVERLWGPIDVLVRNILRNENTN